MHNFKQMTDGEIVDFLVAHIHEFTDDVDSGFPRNIVLGLKSGHLVVRSSERAFAVVARNCGVSFRPPFAELVFLYTDRAARGQGEAQALVSQIKKDPMVGTPIKLLCCGEQRRRFFENQGFHVVDDGDGSPFEMWYALS